MAYSPNRSARLSTLGLSEGQLADLQSKTIALLSGELASLDPATALPAELYHARQRIVSAILEATGGLLNDGQRESWPRVEGVAPRILRGGQAVAEIGLAPGGSRVSSV